MYKRLIILLFAGLFSMGAAAQDHQFHKMAFEKLPSLNAPRGNHRTVVFDGEVAVFGGHTTGFKPIETAEYYKNGSWHSIPMTWPHDGGAITQLKDGRLEVPLLEEWEPILNYSICDDNLRIADYTYLLLFNHRRSNEAAIAKVSGEDFSLLELECPLPSEGPGGEAFFWRGGPQVDRSLRHAWIQGQSLGGNIYFACIGYDATFAGGVGILADEPGLTDDNFNPMADVYLFHTKEPAKATVVPIWAIVLGAVLVCAVILLLVIRKKKPAPEPVAEKAQKLMREHPEMVHADVAEAST